MLFATSTIHADQWEWMNGVIAQKLGSQYVFVFPTSKGRIKAVATPTGKIQIGDNITILYALKVRGKARYIFLDSEKAQATLKPNLIVENKKETYGFLVRDTTQGNLKVYIDQNLIDIGQVVQEKLNSIEKEKIARQGNLNVVLGKGDKVKFKVVRVEISN